MLLEIIPDWTMAPVVVGAMLGRLQG